MPDEQNPDQNPEQQEQQQEQQVQDAFEIPEDLSALATEELTDLHEEAVEVFDSLYRDGSGLSDEELEQLTRLTEGIEAIASEVASRDAQVAERSEEAKQLAGRVRPQRAEGEQSPDEQQPQEGEQLPEQQPMSEQQEQPMAEQQQQESVTAGGRRNPVRVPMSTVRSRQNKRPMPQTGPQQVSDVLMTAGEGLGRAVGQGVTFNDAGDMLNRQLQTFNLSKYQQAANRGQHISERNSLLYLERNIPDHLQVREDSPTHVDAVLDRATDETQLPGGSLTASGGWCAPSETVYELVNEVESRDGLLSIPEVGVQRGGLSFTQGISFAELYQSVAQNGIYFDEATDESGNYSGPNGTKPCIDVPCPTFDEYRLDVSGLCVTAGILASRGYPEALARTLRGLMVAHDHIMNGRVIQEIANGSTQVTMPTTQVGATSPLLDAIELQVEHYKYTRRMSRGTSLEAVFPYWVRGVIRHDLSRRQGVEMLVVTDQQINQWFSELDVNPQFVYNWQPIDDTSASQFTTWPTSMTFLLYASGTWIKGVSDIISLDTVYDSQQLGENNFTALFTEEGFFVAQRGQDSRAVTVSFSDPGSVAAAQPIAWDGTAGS